MPAAGLTIRFSLHDSVHLATALGLLAGGEDLVEIGAP